ncbi:MAG TPA: hypothetical protein VI136_06150 [Verrucomicrobiae bacterium]
MTSPAAADNADPLPEFDFAFPAAYNRAPVIAWSTPATSPYALATSGEITPAATITDADGNLVRVQLYSIAAATGVQTNHLDATFPASNAVTLDALRALKGLTWPIDLGAQEADDQSFDLVCVATDAEGRTTTSTRRVILPGSSSLGLGGITFTEDGYSPAPRPITLEATGVNATQIHWAGRVIGSVAPSTYVTGGTTVNTTVPYSLRIWARASDGVNHSPWQYVDVVL